MSIKIGINGFGRIGRLVFRSAISNDDFKVISIMLFVLFSINNNGTFVRGSKSKLRYIISSLPGFSFAAFKVIIVF